MTTIQIYNFNELSQTAKDTAINNFKDRHEIHLDFFNDDCIQIINERGFKGNIKLQYSLSNCQGDGLSFGCDYFDSEKLHEIFREVLGSGKDKTIETILNNSYFKVKGISGRYCYAHENDLEYTFDDNISAPNIEEVVGKVKEKLVEIYLNLCSELEKIGYDEIEYQYSDEYIANELIELEYNFTEYGKII
jgi:hypothetical protein